MKELQEIIDRIPVGWGKWISCGPGWTDLILKTHKKLLEVDPHYEVHQVKEKFGGLRYYIYSNVDEAWDIIDNAEKESFNICEECGSSGKIRSGEWIRTLCDEHAKKSGGYE